MGDPGERGAYRFGPFQLDVRERRLSRGTDVIPLRLKVFDTLCVLVENAGRLVTKHELLATVWPDTTVEENNLNHNISVLRKALGEKATGQQYIETVPRVGYRFVAPVETAEPGDPRAGGVSSDEPTSRRFAPRRRSGDAPSPLLAVAIVMAIAAAIALYLVPLPHVRSRRGPHGQGQRPDRGLRQHDRRRGLRRDAQAGRGGCNWGRARSSTSCPRNASARRFATSDDRRTSA